MFTVALLGAESTGKSQLAASLAARFEQAGQKTLLVQEPLRQWCIAQGRSPLPHEQWQLAHQHAQTLRQLRTAGTQCGAQSPLQVLIADTTPLQTAAYSAYYFQDTSLDGFATAMHADFFDATLLMGLDLPWQPDPGQRSGAKTQAPVDAHLRRLLNAQPGHSYALVYGQGAVRTENAWRHVAHATKPGHRAEPTNEQRHRHYACTGCGDPDCERRLFSRLKCT